MVAPLFHRRPDVFAAVMRSAMALNGSFFNAERMVIQYVRNAYLPGDGPDQPDPVLPGLAPYLYRRGAGSGAGVPEGVFCGGPPRARAARAHLAALRQ